ncbi:uncharacterized protein LOC143269946 [Peromyscus maniculatus bairdii]|uniref:uncharacterized protein LOC143269946 n=1 Tax=Peromyscus maniculatus bairdii TaxID=230844 RepID=UPI003FD5137B
MALGPLNLPSTIPPFPTPGLDLSHLFLLLRCWKRHPEASLSTFNSVPCAPPRMVGKGLMARRSPLPPLLLFLLLFQASASSQAAWLPHSLVLSQTQTSVSRNGGAAAAMATEPPNCTLDSDPVLVPVFYGLLMTKILVLLALLLRVLRNVCGLHRSFLEASNPSQATSPKKGGLSPSSRGSQELLPNL